jgi:protease I
LLCDWNATEVRVDGEVFRRFSTTANSVWGRVVPDIPDFCRELVAALADE